MQLGWSKTAKQLLMQKISFSVSDVFSFLRFLDFFQIHFLDTSDTLEIMAGEILSTKYHHCFIIQVEFSWVQQMQLGVWESCEPCNGGLSR